MFFKAYKVRILRYSPNSKVLTVFCQEIFMKLGYFFAYMKISAYSTVAKLTIVCYDSRFPLLQRYSGCGLLKFFCHSRVGRGSVGPYESVWQGGSGVAEKGFFWVRNL